MSTDIKLECLRLALVSLATGEVPSPDIVVERAKVYADFVISDEISSTAPRDHAI